MMRACSNDCCASACMLLLERADIKPNLQDKVSTRCTIMPCVDEPLTLHSMLLCCRMDILP